MLRWALGFFIIALVAALLGFGGIAVAAAGIARTLFFIFLILFLVALLGGSLSDGRDNLNEASPAYTGAGFF
jgi:uncharacterized membrane protein YtjA (UPF0391 family)